MSDHQSEARTTCQIAGALPPCPEIIDGLRCTLIGEHGQAEHEVDAHTLVHAADGPERACADVSTSMTISGAFYSCQTHRRPSGIQVAEMTLTVTLEVGYQPGDWDGVEPAYHYAYVTGTRRETVTRLAAGDVVVPALDEDCDPDSLITSALAVAHDLPATGAAGAPETLTLAVELFVDDDGDHERYTVVGAARVTSSAITERMRDLLAYTDGIDMAGVIAEAIRAPLPTAPRPTRHVRVVIDRPGAKARFVELPPVIVLDEVWRLPTNGEGTGALLALARANRLLPEREPIVVWQRLEDLDLGIDAEAVRRNSSAIVFPRAGGAPVGGEPVPEPDGR